MVNKPELSPNLSNGRVRRQCGLTTSIPALNFTPKVIFGNWSGPLRRRQLFSAASVRLKIMAGAVVFDRHHLERSIGAHREVKSRRKANALGAFADAITHPRAADRDRADHDLARRQMPAGPATGDYPRPASRHGHWARPKRRPRPPALAELARSCATPGSVDRQKFVAGRVGKRPCLSRRIFLRRKVEALTPPRDPKSR